MIKVAAAEAPDEFNAFPRQRLLGLLGSIFFYQLVVQGEIQ
jgi:hypothetical protein